MRRWFYRIAGVHFLVTALTGVALYFRAGPGRPGLYGDGVKDVLVMVHNGEWLGALLVGRPFVSGILIGVVLGGLLFRAAWRSLAGGTRGVLEG